MTKRPQCIVVFWLALLIHGLMAFGTRPLVSAASASSLPPGLVAVPQPTPLPEFSLPSPTGTTIRSTDFAGKVVVVRFWATW
jgi:hypothetical protein